MAVYANTVTALMKRAVKVDQITGIGMYVGKCDVTNYNTTLAEITAQAIKVLLRKFILHLDKKGPYTGPHIFFRSGRLLVANGEVSYTVCWTYANSC